MFSPISSSSTAPMKVMLCDMGINTMDEKFCSLSIEQKFEILGTTLIQLQKKLDTEHQITSHQDIRAILIAPEYFFAKGHTADGRHHSVDEFRNIEKGLSLLSRQFPKILLIPGTVAWRKPMPTPEKSQINDTLPNPITAHCALVPATEKMSLQQYGQYKTARGVQFNTDDYYRRYMQKARDSSLLRAKLVLKTELAKNIGHANQGAPNNDHLTKLSQLNQTSLDDLLLSRNTALFYLDGKRVYKYHKRSDYQEVLDRDPNIHIPGVKPPIFAIGNLVFGIEICLDHNCAVLSKYIAKNSELFDLEMTKIRDQRGVDVHLILSATVENQPASFVAKPKGGYLIHSSSFFKNALYAKMGVQPTARKENNERKVIELTF